MRTRYRLAVSATRPLNDLPGSYARVLVIVAHPDDAEYSFGGTIARLTDGGSEVAYAVCTDGSAGGEDPSVPDEAVSSVRYAEQVAAAATLGVTKVEFLGFPDGALEPNLALRLELTRRLRAYRPELVLTHQPLRSLTFPIGASHPDHLATGQAALAAVYPDARNPRAFRQLLGEGLPPHHVAEVWIPGHEHTDLYVDVSPFAERKVEAILRHSSQFMHSADPRAEVEWVVQRMANNGAVAGCSHAEAFKRLMTGAAAAPGPTRSSR